MYKSPGKGASLVIAEEPPAPPLIATDLHSSATAHASLNVWRDNTNKREIEGVSVRTS